MTFYIFYISVVTVHLFVRNAFKFLTLFYIGIVALADHCRCLRELSLSYTLLSDELLLALSSERHVRLEFLRLDVHTDKTDGRLRTISPRCWQVSET
jgi:hypothetical protein